MANKEKTTLYLDIEVKRKAEELGLNLSKVSENALKRAIQAIEAAESGQPLDGQPAAAPAPAAPAAAAILLPAIPREELLAKFRRFLEVDLQRERLTVLGHKQVIARFLEWLGPREITTDLIRDYLEPYKSKDADTYANQLKSLKVFIRDFLGRPGLVASFKFPSKELELKDIPGKPRLKAFFEALLPLNIKAACYFMLYATMGWRRREVMLLYREDVDLDRRIAWPRVKSTTTKRRLIGVFNEEAECVLRKYLAERTDHSPRLLPIAERTFSAVWRQAAAACGFMIEPQLLRDWFCEEMSNRKVPDRYIDAFCGRVPRSILARHYTDYAPEKLKRIYDRAHLKVLS